MININVIVNEKKWFKFLKSPENYLKKKLKKIQQDKIFKKNVKFNFSILLSNSNSIRLLNKKFRKKNNPIARRIVRNNVEFKLNDIK